LSLRFSSPADRGKDHVVASYNDLRNLFLESLPRVISVQVESELQLVSFSGGEVLWEPGDEVEYTYFPHTGMISLLAVMNDGSAIETATVGREGAVGLCRHPTALMAMSCRSRMICCRKCWASAAAPSARSPASCKPMA
jgi:hypothetical protein